MKRLKTISIFILIPLAGLAIWNFGFKSKKENMVLQLQLPVYGHIAQTVTATGTLQPVDTVAVGSQVSGTIKNIYADFNSVVKKGQLLAELDRSLPEATVSQQQAALSEVQSAASFQQSNYNRQRQLFDLGAISKADYESAVNEYHTANAAVQSAQAQLQSAQKNLSYTRIYAPIDGVVLSRSVNVGQTVAASFSTPTLFTIAKDITRMQVQARVDEADIGNVQAGQRATFTVDAFLDQDFSGTVEEVRLNPVVSSNVVTYTTLISADNSEQKLKPGMTATITIYTKEDNHALLIPAKALQYKPDSALEKQYKIIAYKNSSSKAQSKTLSEAFVWTVQGNELVQKKITTGLNDNTQVQVLEGLSASEQVVSGTLTEKQAPASATAPASPFMPKRPGTANRRTAK